MTAPPATGTVEPLAPWVQPALLGWTLLVQLVWCVGPFLAAGRVDWGRGWAYLALLLALVAGHRLYVRARNPTVLHRRKRIGAGTKTWDLWWNALFWPILASVAVVAGLDARRGTVLAGWTWPAGAVLLAAAMTLSALAVAENPFFEGTVRIQADAGQVPIDSGPYARIRHPGYAALSLWALATPLLLGSARAFLPALATVAWVFLRTALEDSTLRRELPGYAGYAGRVRRRLLPGIW